MSYSRLPGNGPASPLLGDDNFPVRPPRRILRFALVPLLLIFIFAASQSSLSSSFDPIKNRIALFGSDDTPVPQAEATALQQEPETIEVEDVVVEEPPPARIEWSEENQQLQRYSWSTPEVHESLERQLAQLSMVRRSFPSSFRPL